jgi:hypothetical protein
MAKGKFSSTWLVFLRKSLLIIKMDGDKDRIKSTIHDQDSHFEQQLLKWMLKISSNPSSITKTHILSKSFFIVEMDASYQIHRPRSIVKEGHVEF